MKELQQRMGLQQDAAFRQSPEGELDRLTKILGHFPTEAQRERDAGVQAPPPKAKYVSTRVDAATGKLWGLNAETNREELIPGAEVFKGPTKTVQGPKVGSFGDFLTKAYGPNPTPKQYEEGRRLWAESGALTTVGTHEVAVPQPDGSLKVFQFETTSSKTGGAPPATKAKPTGPAPANTGRVKPGDTVGGRLTAPVAKAMEDYNAAVKTDSLANQALASKEPVQQRQLALSLIRSMAGRVNMQEFQQYTTRMGVPNTIEGLINGITTGEMPPGVIQQLANAAHANVKASKEALDTAQAEGKPAAAVSGTQHFTEGGNSWDIPADQVNDFKKDHPNAK
jgi:hypothetical protein